MFWLHERVYDTLFYIGNPLVVQAFCKYLEQLVIRIGDRLMAYCRLTLRIIYCKTKHVDQSHLYCSDSRSRSSYH